MWVMESFDVATEFYISIEFVCDSSNDCLGSEEGDGCGSAGELREWRVVGKE